MYCILVSGIPASGKTVLAEYLSASLHIPVVSKDKIKEILFDTIGFRSRTEKVALGTGAMEAMYYFAGQMMRAGQPFLLENNFENVSRPGIQSLLEKYGYQAVTVRLTGDYNVLFNRMIERNNSPDRHKGHIVNDYYQKPEIKLETNLKAKANPVTNLKTKPEASPETNFKANPEINQKTKPEANPETKTKANPVTNPKTKPEGNPEINPKTNPEINIQPVLTQEEFIRGITERGMVEFQLPGPVMEIDTTDFSKVDLRHVTEELRNIISDLKLQ
ncbi:MULTISPECIES: AAA family ATPase [Blautia]|uniref:AAA family ATPase n=1 Tax=Blautia TaxID=572511 RepID=UPI000BA4B06D|nr:MULTISPECIES: AAA family ATPase [Blautia]